MITIGTGLWILIGILALWELVWKGYPGYPAHNLHSLIRENKFIKEK